MEDGNNNNNNNDDNSGTAAAAGGSWVVAVQREPSQLDRWRRYDVLARLRKACPEYADDMEDLYDGIERYACENFWQHEAAWSRSDAHLHWHVAHAAWSAIRSRYRKRTGTEVADTSPYGAEPPTMYGPPYSLPLLRYCREREEATHGLRGNFGVVPEGGLPGDALRALWDEHLQGLPQCPGCGPFEVAIPDGDEAITLSSCLGAATLAQLPGAMRRVSDAVGGGMLKLACHGRPDGVKSLVLTTSPDVDLREPCVPVLLGLLHQDLLLWRHALLTTGPVPLVDFLRRRTTALFEELDGRAARVTREEMAAAEEAHERRRAQLAADPDHELAVLLRAQTKALEDLARRLLATAMRYLDHAQHYRVLKALAVFVRWPDPRLVLPTATLRAMVHDHAREAAERLVLSGVQAVRQGLLPAPEAAMVLRSLVVADTSDPTFGDAAVVLSRAARLSLVRGVAMRPEIDPESAQRVREAVQQLDSAVQDHEAGERKASEREADSLARRFQDMGLEPIRVGADGIQVEQPRPQRTWAEEEEEEEEEEA